MRRARFEEASASIELRFKSSEGDITSGVVRVGVPYKRSTTEWACPVELEGLYGRLADASGASSLQSLSLALGLAHRLLGSFMDEGGHIYEVGEQEPWSRAVLDAVFGYLGELGPPRVTPGEDGGSIV